MDLGFSNELRNQVASKMPNINSNVVNISIALDSKEERKYAGKYDYVHYQSNKFHSLNYFLYLVEIFNEIRYAAISAECCRELLKNKEATKDDLEELGYRFKFYVDSAIYRYYSFWEIVGRFFNEYFDLKLDIDQKNYDKEKGFYFNREVINRIIKDYDHKLLVEVISYWENSQNIFEYRTIKTHTRNTRVGNEILKLTKIKEPSGRTLKIDVGKEFTFNELLKLLMDCHKYARMSLEVLRQLFDLKPDEFEMLKKDYTPKSSILLPDNKTIFQFQKIVTCDSLLIKKIK